MMTKTVSDPAAQPRVNGASLAHPSTQTQATSRLRQRLKVRFPRPMRGAYRAGVRVATAAEEEVEDWMQRILDEGEKLESRYRRLWRRLTPSGQAERQAQLAEAQAQAIQTTEGIEQMIERVLTRLNVPTKSDIDRLSRRITELSQKVDELKAASNPKSG